MTGREAASLRMTGREAASLRMTGRGSEIVPGMAGDSRGSEPPAWQEIWEDDIPVYGAYTFRYEER
ncbi:MAG: hypothetical protein ACYCWE_02985 [Eubacteriales bacterium]